MNSVHGDPEVANPFSTGGGGGAFEHLIGVSYLVTLLAGDIPRGLDWGTCTRVGFQQRWEGGVLDDIVVTSSNGQKERRLALQIKHDLTFSDAPSNKKFARVVDDCWKAFTGAYGWQFNPETDRIGIGIGVYQTDVDRHLRPVLEQARTSRDSEEFFRKISTPGFSHKKKREYVDIFENLLTKAKGSPITRTELWKFLRCLVVLHFDIEHAGSRDAVQSWNRLRDLIKNEDAKQALSLFDILRAGVADSAKNAESIDRERIRGIVLDHGIYLRDELDLSQNLLHLRNHSDTVLSSIQDTIGETLHLQRGHLLDQLEEEIRNHEVVVISGEPMVGKTVILKRLADRLRQEGEVIVFAVERFFGASLEHFLHSIHMENDFQRVLSAIGTAPLRCILIDGLDWVGIDQDKKRILNDIILAVQRYNEEHKKCGGGSEYCWKLVFTVRKESAETIVKHLSLRKNLADRTISFYEVGPLTEEEVATVVDQFPKLRSLASEGHLNDILSRPLVLDILTLPGISLSLEEAPSVLTESWLLDLFWEEIVRLAEGARHGRGTPDQRARFVAALAQQSTLSGEHLQDDPLYSEAIAGLISDRIITREKGEIRFVHEAYGEWTIVKMLISHRNVPGFLNSCNESLTLVRPFRLYASHLLEVERAPEFWAELLDSLEQQKGSLSPRWYQDALGVPLSSPLQDEILPKIGPYLLERNGYLLSKFLKVMRTAHVKPDPVLSSLFSHLPAAEAEKYEALCTVPIHEQWAPTLKWLLSRPDNIQGEALVEFLEIAKIWMKDRRKQDLRREVAEFCFKIWENPPSERCDKETKKSIIEAILWASDCMPDEVDKFVRWNEPIGADLRDVILAYGWVPLCRDLPKTAVEIIGKILCREIKPDPYGGHYHNLSDYGIRWTEWNPPTRIKGPFLALLRLHPDEGLALIHNIVNHATQFWKIHEEQVERRHPLPQKIHLESGEKNVWGDCRVYCWCRFSSAAPSALTCALMALEYQMQEEIKGGRDAKELFETVLRDTCSVAIVGVCTSVGLAHWKTCPELLVPLLENPAFLEMDSYRYVQDMQEETHIEISSKYLSWGQDRADYRLLKDDARQEHRKNFLRNLILPILVMGSTEARSRLQSAMRKFPEHPPLYYEEEKSNTTLLQERIETCRIWAAQAELENYRTIENETEGTIGIEFVMPTELREQQVREREEIESQDQPMKLLLWSSALLEKNEISPTFTIEAAMEYARELSASDDPVQPAEGGLDGLRWRADAVALFAAAVVIRQWDWVQRNGHATWCREQLLIAARRPGPLRVGEEFMKYPFGHARSAARALPVLLTKYPSDKEIREALFGLATHRNNEVRAYLFRALTILWETDQKMVWDCIEEAIALSRGGVGVGGRRHRSFEKPLCECSSREVELHFLCSLLFCLPGDARISVIEPRERLVSLLSDLLAFTINNTINTSKKGFKRDSMVFMEWNQMLFPVVANAILRLPEAEVYPALLAPICSNWEKAPELMENLLWGFLLVGLTPECEGRFVDVWHRVGDVVLSSEIYTASSRYLKEDIKNILGLLIFSDRSGILAATVKDWSPPREMTDIIDCWCSTVSSHPECFPRLVNLLRTIGFSYIPSHGINWLYSCIRGSSNPSAMLEQVCRLNTLPELLHNVWAAYHLVIKQDPDLQQKFIYVVDVTAAQGAPIALQLQRKIEEDIRRGG
jgi:hypothetical protein